MTLALLIRAIARQTKIVIAQLATAGGARARLAQIANQVAFAQESTLPLWPFGCEQRAGGVPEGTVENTTYPAGSYGDKPMRGYLPPG